MRPIQTLHFLPLFSATLFLVLAVAVSSIAQTNTSTPASTGDALAVKQLQALIKDYAKSVGELDLDLARKVWSAGPEVTFIHPRGTERGLEQILKNFYLTTMGTFSKRELLPDAAYLHVYGDTAWSEFTWTFHATVKNGGPEITSRGRETQIYHKEKGVWKLVHVHYSGPPMTGRLKGF
jgi:ketosteroid isomerase-like protein